MLQEDFRMSPEGVRNVGHQESPSMAEIVLRREKERCLALFAHNAAKKPKFHLSHVWTNQYIVASAFQTGKVFPD